MLEMLGHVTTVYGKYSNDWGVRIFEGLALRECSGAYYIDTGS